MHGKTPSLELECTATMPGPEESYFDATPNPSSLNRSVYVSKKQFIVDEYMKKHVIQLLMLWAMQLRANHCRYHGPT